MNAKEICIKIYVYSHNWGIDEGEKKKKIKTVNKFIGKNVELLNYLFKFL